MGHRTLWPKMGCSVGFKYANNALQPCSATDPTGKAHDAPPDLLFRGGRKGRGAKYFACSNLFFLFFYYEQIYLSIYWTDYHNFL